MTFVRAACGLDVLQTPQSAWTRPAMYSAGNPCSARRRKSCHDEVTRLHEHWLPPGCLALSRKVAMDAGLISVWRDLFRPPKLASSSSFPLGISTYLLTHRRLAIWDNVGWPDRIGAFELCWMCHSIHDTNCRTPQPANGIEDTVKQQLTGRSRHGQPRSHDRERYASLPTTALFPAVRACGRADRWLGRLRVPRDDRRSQQLYSRGQTR